MQLSKSTISSILGLLGLVFFIVLAYVNNYAFLDKIVVCSLIIVLVLLIKTRGEAHHPNRKSNAS